MYKSNDGVLVGPANNDAAFVVRFNEILHVVERYTFLSTVASSVVSQHTKGWVVGFMEKEIHRF